MKDSRPYKILAFHTSHISYLQEACWSHGERSGFKPRSPFLEGPEMFSHPESRFKISNLMITELFYSHIINMNRGSLHTRSLRRIHLSVFRYRLIENGFSGPKSFRSFRETGPKNKSVFANVFSSLQPWVAKSEKIKINKLSGTCDYLTSRLPLENEKKKMKKIELANIQIA